MAKKLSLLLCAAMGCIIALAVAGNLYWCVKGQTFTGPDVGNHLIFSVEYYYKLTGLFSAGAGSLAWRAVQLAALPLLPVAHSSPLYPNVVYGLTSLWYLLFGQSLAVAKLSNLLFLAVLAAATYLLGRRYSSREGGALAAALVVLYPAVYESSRQYGLDLPLAAMTALCMLLLVESDTLGREKLVLPLGLVTGIGVLVKPQLLLFLAVPLLVVLVRVLRDRTVEGPVRRRNLRQCALAACIVVAIAFLPRLPLIVRDLPRFRMPYTVDKLDGEALKARLRTGAPRPVDALLLKKLRAQKTPFDRLTPEQVQKGFNEVLYDFRLYREVDAAMLPLSPESQTLLRRVSERPLLLRVLSHNETLRLNLALLKALYPDETRECTVVDPFYIGRGLSYAQRVEQLRAAVIHEAMGLPLFAVFLFGLAVVLIVRVEGKGLLLAWLLPPALFFAVSSWLAGCRHLMPLLPAAAVVTAVGVMRLRPGFLRWPLLLVIAVVLPAQYVTMTFGGPDCRERMRERYGFGRTYFSDTLVLDDRYNVAGVADALRQDPSPEKRLLVVSLCLPAELDPFELRYRLRSKDRSVDLLDLCGMYVSVASNFSFDYVLFRLPAGPDGQEWPSQERFRSLLQENSQPYLYYLFNASGKADELIGTLYAQRPEYRFVARIPTRSGISWVLYRRQNGGLPVPR